MDNSQRYNASKSFHWCAVILVMVVDVKVQNYFRINRLTSSINGRAGVSYYMMSGRSVLVRN